MIARAWQTRVKPGNQGSHGKKTTAHDADMDFNVLTESDVAVFLCLNDIDRKPDQNHAYEAYAVSTVRTRCCVQSTRKSILTDLQKPIQTRCLVIPSACVAHAVPRSNRQVSCTSPTVEVQQAK